MTDLLKHTCIF